MVETTALRDVLQNRHGSGNTGYVVLTAALAVAGIGGFKHVGASAEQTMVGTTHADMAQDTPRVGGSFGAASTAQVGQAAREESARRAGSCFHCVRPPIPFPPPTFDGELSPEGQAKQVAYREARAQREQSFIEEAVDWFSRKAGAIANSPARRDNWWVNTSSGVLGVMSQGFLGPILALGTVNMSVLETLGAIAATPFVALADVTGFDTLFGTELDVQDLWRYPATRLLGSMTARSWEDATVFAGRVFKTKRPLEPRDFNLGFMSQMSLSDWRAYRVDPQDSSLNTSDTIRGDLSSFLRTAGMAPSEVEMTDYTKITAGDEVLQVRTTGTLEDGFKSTVDVYDATGTLVESHTINATTKNQSLGAFEEQMRKTIERVLRSFSDVGPDEPRQISRQTTYYESSKAQEDRTAREVRVQSLQRPGERDYVNVKATVVNRDDLKAEHANWSLRGNDEMPTLAGELPKWQLSYEVQKAQYGKIQR